MVSAKYCLASILSGVLWGILGSVIFKGISDVWFAVAASPLIGLAAGLLFLPACRWSLTKRIFLSLATLFVGVTLFGLCAGIQEGLQHDPNVLLSIAENILAIWWGLTFGYFLFLWPLSFANHALVCRFATPKAR